MYQRYQRVTSLLLSELNKLLLREVEFPNTLITVTNIDVQKDLDAATVNVSVLPNNRTEDVVNSLNKRRKYLQHLLLKQINIKPMPELRFKADYGMKEAANIEKVFLDIEKENEKE